MSLTHFYGYTCELLPAAPLFPGLFPPAPPLPMLYVTLEVVMVLPPAFTIFSAAEAETA